MKTPNNFEEKIEEILEPMTFNIISRNYGASSAECRAERILAIEAISTLCEERVREAREEIKEHAIGCTVTKTTVVKHQDIMLKPGDSFYAVPLPCIKELEK